MGHKKKKITVKYVTASGKELEYTTRFNGILAFYREQYDQTGSSDIRATIEKYMHGMECDECGGGRLKATKSCCENR
jgi:excinuclease ABC subunit A